MNINNERFIKSLQQLNIEITNNQLDQFVKFYNFLVEKNKVMNLTGITEYEEVVTKHFVDSLSIVKICDMKNVDSMIDMGTGAGFPGVPIKIMFPDIKVTLMDSLNKRINFLKEASDICGFDNIDFVHGRAEELGQNSLYREKYDLCVSRAVANLSVLSEYCLPFVKPEGSFICYKAGNSNEEIESAKNAISILKGKIDSQIDFCLPESDITRTLLKIDKVDRLQKKYPRKAGTPTRSPLV